MVRSFHSIQFSVIAACLAIATPSVMAADPVRIVFQNGRSIVVSALAVQGDQLVVKTAVDGYNEGQTFAAATTDHVYGDKPVEINQALAMVLMDKSKAKEAQRLLLPVLEQQKITAKIPGNYWVEAAKVVLLTHALNGDSTACSAIGKEISDATPAQGIDPMVSLGKALMVPSLSKFEERDAALKDQTTDNLPAEVCAFASFYRGELCLSEKRNPQALESYLAVTCVHPSGSLVLNAAAEIKAADLLAESGKRDEALALAKSAARSAPGTVIAQEANKRLESLK